MKKFNILDIVIVNWNAKDLLLRCVNSILNSDLTNIEYSIVIVDNNSEDDSLKQLPQNERIVIIKNDINRGFAAACNEGVRRTHSDFVLFLNPDTEIEFDTIKKSLEFMEKYPNITVLGCRQVDKYGKVLRTSARFMTVGNCINKLTGLSKFFPKAFPDYHMLDWDHNDSREVDHVMGSYYLISRHNLQKVNLIDEDFFIYYEDLDLSYRIKKNGGRVYFNADITIFHETGGTSKQVKAKRLYYSLFAKIQYFKKHFSSFNFIFSTFLLLVIEPIIRLFFAIAKLNLQELKETCKAYSLLYQSVFGNLKPIEIANSH